jgi:DNA-binding NarL/FixJ family response regulator
MDGGPTKTSVLLLRQPGVNVARLQVEPLRRAVRGMHLRVVEASDDRHRLHAIERVGPDVVLFQIDWRDDATAAAETARCLRSALDVNESSRKLIFLDYYDGCTSPHTAVLPKVDVYVKKQVPIDPQQLARQAASGGMLAAELRRIHQLPPADDSPNALLSEQSARKVVVGWNVGASDFIRRLLLRHRLRYLGRLGPRRVRAHRRRDIDVHCRLCVGRPGVHDWYRAHREHALGQLGHLPSNVRRVAGAFEDGHRPLRKAAYLRELRRSRICVSPFGYGEICYRDFEAVASGCLLVKPDMSHLRTEPDVFEPFKTFVPTRWDLADLPARVRWALDHPAEAQRIAETARHRLVEHHLRGPSVVDRLLVADQPPAGFSSSVRHLAATDLRTRMNGRS